MLVTFILQMHIPDEDVPEDEADRDEALWPHLLEALKQAEDSTFQENFEHWEIEVD